VTLRKVRRRDWWGSSVIYVGIALLLTGLVVRLLWVGYGFPFSDPIDPAKDGTAASWVSALLSAIGPLLIVYQLGLLRTSARRARQGNIALVRSTAVYARRMSTDGQRGWLVSIGASLAHASARDTTAVWVTGLTYSFLDASSPGQAKKGKIDRGWVIRDEASSTLKRRVKRSVQRVVFRNASLLTEEFTTLGAIHIPAEKVNGGAELGRALKIDVLLLAGDVPHRHRVSGISSVSSALTTRRHR
jgi:hypothetical protein